MKKSDRIKSRIGSNIRWLRESKSWSIVELAERLEISSPGLYSYESGRTEPEGQMLLMLAKIFDISLDHLIGTELSNYKNKSALKLGTGRVLFPVRVDADNEDLIELVPIKAVAGYTGGHSDPEFIGALPTIRLPFLSKRKKYRAFQIEGDSMLPIPSGSYIVSEFEEDNRNIQEGEMYIFLILNEGLVFKVAYFSKKSRSKIILHSLNSAYDPYEIEWENVQEVWKFVNYISSEIPTFAHPDPLQSLVMAEREVSKISEGRKKKRLNS